MPEKKYLVDNPALMAEWHWEKNGSLNLNPTLLTLGTQKKVWWICEKGHEWQATVVNRNRGTRCPYCTGQMVIRGKNDLKTINPLLASEWDYELNADLTPYDVLPNSNRKVWWICEEGHQWNTSINNRSNGNGCPYCSGRYAIKGENDLETLNPLLVKEWNHEKNGTLKPSDVLPNSNKKVWWICNKGHEWQSKVDHRNNGSGCPICKSERRTSFPEYTLVYYLKKYGLDVLHSYKNKGFELDIFIPSKKIAIEYDGDYWHKNKTKSDLEKNRKCKNEGIILYRIREGLPLLNDTSIDYIVQKNQKDLSIVIQKVLSLIIGVNVEVNIKKDSIAIENLRIYMEKDSSFLYSNPTLSKEWNYEKNGNLRPEHFTVGSHKYVWWQCCKGHEWQSTIKDRNQGNGCPYCSNKKLLQGYNDFLTINPILAKEWNDILNKNLKPFQVFPNSNKKVWWKCKKGHEWQATVNNRSNGRGCPYCSNKKVFQGYNDLKTQNSNLTNEWHYKLNSNLKPENFTAHSGKKVWWICRNGHEWQASIDNRNRGNCCPYCSNKKVIEGYNDLKTVNPTLANEWNYILNNDLVPSKISPHSGKKVWWKCENGHEWQATVNNRSNGRGCPYCAKRRKLTSKN